MKPEMSIPGQGAEKSRTNTAPGSTDRGTGVGGPHRRSEAVQWGQGENCAHKPEWRCEDHGECRGCECGCDTVNPEPDLTSAHWLKWDTIARTITGCQCGFAADIDSDCGFGDSVVLHLLEVGAEAASIERGREIAEQMMDRAEARHRHERGQVHRRDECEDCAREAVAAAARPVHYREAIGSLRAIAEHRKHTAPDAIAYARAEGIEQAVTALVRGLEDEGGTDGDA